MATGLNTTTDTGSQTTTQDPQSSTESSLSGASNSSIQSGNTDSLFNSQNGISLKPANVSIVTPDTSTSQVQATPPKAVTHHTSGLLLGFFVILVILAIASFWRVSISEKNTTE